MPKIEKKCPVCGTVFFTFPLQDKLFCSRECTDKGRSLGIIGGKKRRGEEITCIVCGKVVYKSPSNIKRGGGKVCSPKCNGIARSRGLIEWQPVTPPKNGETLRCVICGKEFYRKASYIRRGISKTCGSKECMSAYGRLSIGLPALDAADVGKARYQIDKSTVWLPSQKRAWIDTKCAICGAESDLILDHIVPVSLGGKSVRENAQTLCKACHAIKSREELLQARQQTNLGGYTVG